MSDIVKRFNDREVLEFGGLRNSIYFKTDRITSGVGGLSPGGRGAVDEGHEGAEEVFTIISGQLTLILPDSNERWTLVMGDAAIVPPGARHIVENNGKEETIFAFSVSPGLKGI